MPSVGKIAEKDIQEPQKNDTGSNDSTSVPPVVSEDQISGSMKTEEPTGWDQAPQAIDNPREKRHPRPDGVGGVKPADGPDRASDHM